MGVKIVGNILAHVNPGPLPIAQGGTGATTATGAINALLPPQSGNPGKVLATDGTNVSWVTGGGGGGSGTVTSVDVSGGTTGLTTGGGPVTTAGTITLDGILNITNGGTGATSADGAFNALVPSQSSNAGKFLTTDGTNASWSTISAGVTSFNTRTGAVSLTSGDVTAALGFTPYSATNPNGYTSNTGTVTNVTGTGSVSGLTLTGSVSSSGNLTLGGTLSLTSTNVTTGLGYTPVNRAGSTMTGLLILSGDPVAALGAATKQYVDNISAGVIVHAACVTSTTAAGNLTAANYNNGAGGVGATLTATTNGSINSINAGAGVGGYNALTAGNRVLVKDQADQKQNGIYTVSVIGTGSVPWVLTRATDFDGSPVNEVQAGDLTYIQSGSNAGTQWVQTDVGTGVNPSPAYNYIIIGTDNIVFTQFSGAGNYAAGTGIDIDSNTISNTGVLSNLAGTGISVSSVTGDVTITNTGVTSFQSTLSGISPAVSSIGGIVLSGTLDISSGGTGQTTASGAINALVPSQTGNNGKVLTTNGSSVAWTTASAGTVTNVAVSGGTTGLNTSGGPITSSGTITLGGTLNIANGGTGATSASGAINALVPSQSGNNGKVLTTNGTSVSWGLSSAGTVTSITVSGGTTGLTTSGGPITSSGTITLAGTLAVANGGTGQTTGNAAFNALAPNQAGNSGKVLTTDGTNTSWTTASAGTVTSVAVSGGTTGITVTGSPVTSSGTMTLGGTLAVANGGTGQTTTTGAINALVPSQTGNNGKVLTTDGNTVSWTTASAGTVTSVEFSTGSTGLSVTGSPITSSGTITLAGTLAVANGGTGQNTTTAAINALMPLQTGNVGRFLSTNGVAVAWTALPAFGSSSAGIVPASGGGTSNFLRADGTWTSAAFNGGTISGATTFSAGTASSSTTTGALIVTNSGGLGVTGVLSINTYTETNTAITSSASQNFNCALGTVFNVTLSNSITSLTFSNIPASGRVYNLTLVVTQGVGGSKTIAWPGSVKWAGTAPTLSTVAGKIDVITLMTFDGGTSWLGFPCGIGF
jgi:hypothetical protein